MDHALNLDSAKRKRAEEMRVAEILKALGYERKRKQIDGKRQWVYESPNLSSKNALPVLPVPTPELEVGHAVNQIEQNFQSSAPPVLTSNNKTQKNQRVEPQCISENLPQEVGQVGHEPKTTDVMGSLAVPMSKARLGQVGQLGQLGRAGFKEGATVEYVGSRYTCYEGLKLQILNITDDGIACSTPSGNITTWIPPRDLKLA